MTRVCLMILLIIFGAVPVYATPYEVVSIQSSGAEIKDLNNNKISKIKVGDLLEDGWKVITIEADSIIIEKCLNEEECFRSILPYMIVREKKQ